VSKRSKHHDSNQIQIPFACGNRWHRHCVLAFFSSSTRVLLRSPEQETTYSDAHESVQFDSEPRFCDAFLRFSQGFPQGFPKMQRKFGTDEYPPFRTEQKLRRSAAVRAGYRCGSTLAARKNAETTAGQQEIRDTGSAGDASRTSDRQPPIPATDVAGRQAYDRSRKTPRDFRRSGQIHSDTQDRIE